MQETAKIFKNLKEAMKRLKAAKPEQKSSETLLGSLQCKHHGPKEPKWLGMLVRVCNPSTSRLRQEDAKCDVCLKYIVKSCYNKFNSCHSMPIQGELTLKH